VTSVAAGIKGLLSATRAVAGLIKRAGSSEALRARLVASGEEVERDAIQVCYGVCKALVANALDREPSDEDVSDVLSAAISDPAFPHRAYRLFGEIKKSASRRRRAFLASVLFGLPFSKLPDDERDRIDMAVERMMPADVELLMAIVEKDRAARPTPETEPYLFRGTKIAATLRGIEVRLGSTDDYEDEGRGFSDEYYADARFLVDHAAFGALLSFGLLDVGQSQQVQGDWQIHRLVITPLGKLVVQAIEELRPGFDAHCDDGKPQSTR